MTATYVSGTATVIQFLGLTGVTYTDYITDIEIQNSLNRAQDQVDTATRNHWCNATDDSPDWKQVEDEKQRGKGMYDRDYYTINHPIPNITAIVETDVAVGGGTVIVDSSTGFAASGVINVGANKITYTSKNAGGTAFIGCSGVTEAISADDIVYPYCFEISTTNAGSASSWEVLQNGTDYDLDFNSGRVHIYRNDIVLDVLTTSNPPRMLPNRFRATYIWGSSPIDEDIQRGTLLIASRDLSHQIVRRATILGLNSFKPEMINLDDTEIKDFIEEHRNDRITNIF